MSRRGILAISMCVNLLLVAALALAFRGSPIPAAAGASEKPIPGLANTASPGSPPPVMTITNRFHWRQVESPNYEQYLLNLRAIGCPEKTVRDILVKDIAKTFALRTARLPGPTNFWACGPEREAAEAFRRQQVTALRREQRELTRRLLGVDSHGGASDFDDLAAQAILYFLTGTTREGAWEKVERVFKWAEIAEDEIREAANGWDTPASEAESLRLQEQALEQLRAALTPAEFEEFGLRLTAVKMMDGDFDDFKCSALELRAMAEAYYQTVGLSDLKLGLFGAGNDLTEQQEDQLRTRLIAALGEHRFEDFRMETDSDYRSLVEFVRASNLPGKTAGVLADVRRLAERERRRVLEDAALSGTARRERLQEIRRATLEGAQAQLGDTVYREYVRLGLAGWIEELGRP